MAGKLEELEERLKHFDASVRQEALQAISAEIRAGRLPLPPLSGAVNVHLHTFFSYNAEGYSPSRLIWEARKRGLDVVGSVDFDVLDAMEEIRDAAEMLEIRYVSALESRTYVASFCDRDINSPGEPGVAYFMGTGFTRFPEPGSQAASCLAAMRAQARKRNEELLARLLPTLAPLTLDYEKDVLPLAPSGNATERHMLAAMDQKAHTLYPDRSQRACYWAERLGMAQEEILKILDSPAKLRNTLRAKLMKRGGPGYVQPTASTFPPIREVVDMIVACGALPCAAWLDGTSAGEADADALLDLYLDLGCLAFNIIPDRNWNITDPQLKARKLAKLQEIVAKVKERHLFFSIGTEMNADGQPFVDAFQTPELAPFAQDFRDGAYALYGHTLLERTLRQGRGSRWAQETFGEKGEEALSFYLDVGRRGFPPLRARQHLEKKLRPGADRRDILRILSAL